LSRWHKDIDDEGVLKDLVYRPDGWHVYKAAIYLQDQPDGSPQVLKVRPRSQHRRLGEVAHEQALAIRAGDVIVFDVRVDHAGQFPSIWDKSLRRMLMLGCGIFGYDAEAWFSTLRSALCKGVRRADERMAIYLTFGRPDPVTYAYEETGRQNHGPLPAALDEDVRKRLAGRNITLIEKAL
jgi:hypothetical protein